MFLFIVLLICYNVSFTFKTSCKEDILPKGLGDFGNEGGAADGLCGAARFAPTPTAQWNNKQMNCVLIKTIKSNV